MKQSSFAIPLAPEENAQLVLIELEAARIRGPAQAVPNGERVAALLAMLVKRKAIPKHRLRWFTDPDCFIGGRGSSREDVFLRRVPNGDALVRHIQFLAYLRYFLFGPDLPQPAIDAFCRKVNDCGQVTSGDIIPLSQFARTLSKAHRLERKKAADEFFKLALECGLSANYGASVRNTVIRS
jgi:hypothetical protein